MEEYCFTIEKNKVKNKHQTIFHFVLILVAIAVQSASAQKQKDFQFLKDPSFEILNGSYVDGENPSRGLRHKYWFDCGFKTFPRESQSGIRTNQATAFSKGYPPSDGKLYIELVARENGSYESVTQKMMNRIKAESCYEFEIDIRHDEYFVSRVRKIDNTSEPKLVSFVKPICLSVGMSKNSCNVDQEVFVSKPILNAEWQRQKVIFKADGNYKYIVLRAKHVEGYDLYNGNLLIDNMSELSEVECGNEN